MSNFLFYTKDQNINCNGAEHEHQNINCIEDVVGQVILLETWSSQLSADKGRLAFACCESRVQSLPHWQWALLTVFAWLKCASHLAHFVSLFVQGPQTFA
jgi:hypothetical protein